MLVNFTGHGFSDFLSSHSWIGKLLWALFISASIFGCLAFIRSSVLQFIHYDVVTTIKIRGLSQLIFPSVTLCRSYNNTNIFDAKQIISCYFAGEESCFENFEKIIIYASGSYRSCLRFNGKRNSSNKKVFFSQNFGYHFGLKISLHLPVEQATYMNIADNRVAPVDGSFLTFLSGGSTTEISMKKAVQSALGPPYSDCVNSNKLIIKSINSGYIYQKANCQNDCFYRHYTKVCNCSLPGLNEVNHVEPCVKYSNCYLEHFKNFDYEAKCAECPIECEKIAFNTLKESAHMQENAFLEFKDKLIQKGYDIINKSDADLRKELLKLYIYFETMEQTEINQSPHTTVTDLISNVGGTLGLFLGVSIISFVEIGELIVKISLILMKRCINK